MVTRWGILSTAAIGMQHVIPAIQKAANCEVVAIASRSVQKAQNAANQLGIAKAYGSYEALLNDKDIDVVYNPLPNHLHVPYTLKALEAGKHVLCEKPIALNAHEAACFVEETQKFPHLKVMEAFMYRFHPQWAAIKKMVSEGAIGEVKTIHTNFSFFNTDPTNTRNILEIGGGALLDIGCYCISFPRYIFNKEPQRVVSLIVRDTEMKIDQLSSAMLDFGNGITATFTCSIQLMHGQSAHIMGTKGRILVDIPVNAPANKPTKITVVTSSSSREIYFDAVDQYALQAQEFANAVIENKPVPTPLTDALNNMKVIEALFRSEQAAAWVEV